MNLDSLDFDKTMDGPTAKVQMTVSLSREWSGTSWKNTVSQKPTVHFSIATQVSSAQNGSPPVRPPFLILTVG